MTETRTAAIPISPGEHKARVARNLRRRRRAEQRYRLYGLAAVLFACAMLGVLLVSIVREGYSAFAQTSFHLEVPLPKQDIDPEGRGAEAIRGANLQALIEDA
jgi:phosphate transport system permease protein